MLQVVSRTLETVSLTTLALTPPPWHHNPRPETSTYRARRFTAQDETGMAARRWRDGSLEEDLPMRGLREMFNINYFLCRRPSISCIRDGVV